MSIYQRNGIWYARFSVPGHPRVRCSTGTADRKAAQEYHDRLKAQMWRTAKLGETPDRTFDEAALEMLKLSAGQKGYSAKVQQVKYWRKALGGSTPIRSLTADIIMGNVPTHSLHAGPKKKDANRKPKTLKAATKNRYLATMRRILSVAVDREWIAKVPKLGVFEEPKTRVRWEPQAVITKLIKAMTLEWMRDVSLVAVATGMREDELLTMEPRHVDLTQRHTYVDAERSKSGVARAVPLNADAMKVLKQRIPLAKKYVFERPSRDGVVRKISQVDARCLKSACKKIGISDFTFHDFRHTWASWHVQRGTQLMVLKELGGWETIEMVQKYAHLAQSHLAHHAESVTFLAQEDSGKKKAA